MTNQILELHMSRLQLDVTGIRADIADIKRQEQLANRDREFRRDLTIDGLLILLQATVLLLALAHGFKWL